MVLKKSTLSFAKMAIAKFLTVLMLMEVIVSDYQFGAVDGLNMDYYQMTCPFAEMIVKYTVNRALQNDPTLAAALVRMHFHDCFIEGCDGSILIDSTKDNTAEKDSPGNLSLRGYEAGGPAYDIPKGRMDGRRSKIEDTINLPFPSFNSSQLIRAFGQRGFSVQEMVALSGAHTLGVARCSSFKARLGNADTTLDSDFAKTLSKTCSAGDNAVQPFDDTQNTFDNFYYYTLLRQNGLLFSDQQLYISPMTNFIVNAYAMNQQMFFFDFQQAMVKMGILDVKDGSKGEVRQNCRKVN
ncbi:hypothetical protein SLEP1_g3098 [Rubroshorea leprosula]|uniref:Peroxidase n=1 Tax=Rubroshorea leprosula TaxID=152421 RepID=A0AAV5HNL9_9ROSI|nr:hypothetical protein SLEP1_g3098 [Rubroshorea leprosula]